MVLIVKIVFFALIIYNVTSFAFARCSLHISDIPALRPKVLLTVGSRQVDLSLHSNDKTLTIFENQNITLQCKSKFMHSERLSHKNKLSLTCGYELCDAEGQCYRDSGDALFHCSPQQWNLYESNKNFVWCPKDTSSYIIARPTDPDATAFEYLAGVCYNINNLMFKSIYYTISSQSLPSAPPAVLTRQYAPATELEHIKDTFGTKTVLARDYAHQATENYIEFAQYNYSSIIQNDLLMQEYDDQLGSLLDVIWWPNLRLGNWKRYEMALKKQLNSKDRSFEIIAGVSGVVAAPVTKTCDTQFTLTDLADNTNSNIPLYIWNYLRSPSDSSDEIVIIGVNSPFYEFYNETSIVFCQDKCKEIAWLKKTASTFRYRALGIMFCCSAKDVKLSKRLEGSPDVN